MSPFSNCPFNRLLKSNTSVGVPSSASALGGSADWGVEAGGADDGTELGLGATLGVPEGALDTEVSVLPVDDGAAEVPPPTEAALPLSPPPPG